MKRFLTITLSLLLLAVGCSREQPELISKNAASPPEGLAAEPFAAADEDLDQADVHSRARAELAAKALIAQLGLDESQVEVDCRLVERTTQPDPDNPSLLVAVDEYAVSLVVRGDGVVGGVRENSAIFRNL